MARTPFQIQKAVIFALFVRELKTRFGKYRLGYVWALLEPMAHVIVLSLIWSAMGHTAINDIPVPLFLMTGIVPYLFFTSACTLSMNAIESNRGLFNYRQVRPIDPVIARIILEIIINVLSYILLLFIAGWFFNFNLEIDNLLGLLGINILLFFSALGFGLIFSVYGALYPEVMKVVPMLVFRPLYFMSGTMFPLSIVPTEYHDWLLWNPLLHVVEFNHFYFFHGFETGSISLFFVLLFSMGSLTFGLLSYRANWIRVIST